MSYKKAANILPAPLLAAVQYYVDGECLYIPRKEEHKKSWGEVTQSRTHREHRNKEIQNRYEDGHPVRSLAEEYFLSEKTIYNIIAMKKRV